MGNVDSGLARMVISVRVGAVAQPVERASLVRVIRAVVSLVPTAPPARARSVGRRHFRRKQALARWSELIDSRLQMKPRLTSSTMSICGRADQWACCWLAGGGPQVYSLRMLPLPRQVSAANPRASQPVQARTWVAHMVSIGRACTPPIIPARLLITE